MKTATILPTPYLHLTRNDDYHMCLAHLIGKDVDYTDFYKQIGNEGGKYLIMDNGVIEGDCRPIEEIVKKALMVHADEIILPDVFKNMGATIEKGYKALRYVRDNFPLKIMAVPQGETLDQWLECAITMIDWDIDCIGVPKVLVKIAGRDGRLDALEMLGNKLRGLDIHLLGCWTTSLEITLIARAEADKHIRPIRGVDSSIAYVYTRAGILLSEDDRPNGDPIDFTDATVDMKLLRRNIEIWKEAAVLNDSGISRIY